MVARRTIRTVFALVAHMDLVIEQIDVVIAFINGDLDREVHMDVSDGFKNSINENMECKHLNSLYGLKQSPGRWYAKIHDSLVNNLGFRVSENDPCLYVRHV